MVIRSTTEEVSNRDFGPTATTRPRRSTATRSATEKTSFRLCEMTMTAMPWAFSRR